VCACSGFEISSDPSRSLQQLLTSTRPTDSPVNRETLLGFRRSTSEDSTRGDCRDRQNLCGRPLDMNDGGRIQGKAVGSGTRGFRTRVEFSQRNHSSAMIGAFTRTSSTSWGPYLKLWVVLRCFGSVAVLRRLQEPDRGESVSPFTRSWGTLSCITSPLPLLGFN
jgi:hypothetical protein